jgi:hypothetical protein
MKKSFFIIFIFSLLNLNSQTEFVAQKFDLESIGKQKRWGFYSGFKNENGEFVIKIGQAICGPEKEEDPTTYSYVFKGLSWKFEELTFDQNLIYKNAVKKDFTSTMDVIKYEPVWGEKFVTVTNTGSSELLTTDFIGKKTVIPSFGVGTKLTLGNVFGKKGGGVNRGTFGNAGVGCSELPDFAQLASNTPVCVKGELWTGIRGFPIIGGAVALYHVGGKYKEKDKLHYVLNQYNDKMVVVKSLSFDFDYMNMAQIVRVKLEDGVWDYVIILQTSNEISPEEISIAEADVVEIVYVDGKSFEEKFRSKTNLPFTNWFVRNADIAPDGSVYLLGPAGKNNEDYMPGTGAAYTISDINSGPKNLHNHPNKLPNYQIARLKDDKVYMITGTDTEMAKTKINVLTGSGIKTNSKPTFNVPSTSFYNSWNPNQVSKEVIKYYFKNSKIIVCFQPFSELNAAGKYEFGNLVTAIFDANGMLESYIIKPERNFSNSTEFFGLNDKMMYVAYYDMDKLNTTVSDGVYLPNKIPRFIGANLQFAKIDINTYSNKAETVDLLGTDEWAVSANCPVLVETNKEIIFLAKPISKTVKDSEFLFIKIDKD